MNATVEDLTGKQLGPYHIVAIVGKGGMGVVYQAYETKLTRYVALKVLSRRYADDLNFVSRFWQEAKAAANLEHPHILPIYAYGEHDRYHYIAMQLVRDGSLADLLQGRPLLLRQIGHIVNQVGSALDYAHSQNVIHRDVKPDNILISRQSGCLLTDFGIAKLLEATSPQTQTGISFGTPAYMSPEQIRGDDNIDGRSDIYSLGVVLYEMATGRVPFQGPTVQAIQMQHLSKLPLPPRELNRELPRPVEEVILKALAKKPNERFATAGELAQALQTALPEDLKPGAVGAAAILSGTPSAEMVDDRISEDGKPIDSEELTAILEAASAAPSIEDRQRAPTEPIPSVSLTGRLQSIRITVWVAALILLVAIVVGVVGFAGLGDSLFARGITPTLAGTLGGADTETPTAAAPTETLAPVAVVTTAEPKSPTAASGTAAATRTPPAGPGASDTQEPTPTSTPADTAAAEATSTPPRADTATRTATPTRTGTASATSTSTPTSTPTIQATQPRPPDLSGRLAIPLMYGNEPKVYIADTDGELETVVGGARQPDYTRDGSRLIVNGSYGTWDKLRVLDPSGGAPFEIGDPALAGHSFPSWSPDGTMVIYEDSTIDPRGPRIYVRDLNTNGPGSGPGTVLSAGVGRGELLGQNPVWGSGERFIFRGCNTWEPGKESECGVWLMQGNSGEPERLTANPQHVPMDVNADTLVYVSPEAGDWNVYNLDLRTGATQQLTTDPAADGAAVISPDGRSVAFLSNQGGSLAVWRVGIQGGVPQKLFDLPIEWGGLRPDGWAEEKLGWGAR